mmetsp:Transcript_19851/g.56144  ORF Transcript_19851/g.56144 Transcript_19851/m.56144 type:complete len:297 (-) Transcript_19851:2748-3638(-)
MQLHTAIPFLIIQGTRCFGRSFGGGLDGGLPDAFHPIHRRAKDEADNATPKDGTDRIVHPIQSEQHRIDAFQNLHDESGDRTQRPTEACDHAHKHSSFAGSRIARQDAAQRSRKRARENVARERPDGEVGSPIVQFGEPPSGDDAQRRKEQAQCQQASIGASEEVESRQLGDESENEQRCDDGTDGWRLVSAFFFVDRSSSLRARLSAIPVMRWCNGTTQRVAAAMIGIIIHAQSDSVPATFITTGLSSASPYEYVNRNMLPESVRNDRELNAKSQANKGLSEFSHLEQADHRGQP